MVEAAFTLPVRVDLTGADAGAVGADGETAMEMLFVVDREAYDGATALVAEFGWNALSEASARAERSRGIGNHIHYTRWCRVGRAILVLEDPDPRGALH